MQTDGTSHNIVSPTMLEVVGTCCVVHANVRNNCQHCWRFSKEAMHSGTVTLKKDCNAHVQTFSRGQLCCGSMQTDATCWAQQYCVLLVNYRMYRDRGATLRLGGGGGTVSDSILGGTRRFFLLTLYNFKNIGGARAPHGPPCSAIPDVASVCMGLI